MTGPFIRRVTIRNYKSIAACKVDLHSLMFLVGRNGVGKSNFLDALRLVAESLRTSLDHALRERGTIREVRRRSGGHPNHFAIRLDFSMPGAHHGHYSFRIGAKPGGGYEVQSEECEVATVMGQQHFYVVKSGEVVGTSLRQYPASVSDRLYLVAASGLPEFRPIFDALSGIQVYNLNPREISAMQQPDPGDLLRRDGSNAASVLQQLGPEARDRISDYLSRIIPGVASAEPKTLGSQETIEFRQTVKGQGHPWRFLASSMSDGTLRAFGILLAIFQTEAAARANRSPLLIGLEEPEMALNPAATSILLASLREASRRVQILVTSHSPDLLDDERISSESLLGVDNDSGLTRIGPVDAAGRMILREKLFTPGELLRLNQLTPDPGAVVDVKSDRQLGLFEHRAAS
jgi:predicted ATPase